MVSGSFTYEICQHGEWVVFFSRDLSWCLHNCLFTRTVSIVRASFFFEDMLSRVAGRLFTTCPVIATVSCAVLVASA